MVQTCKSQTLKALLLLPRARACTGVVATHQSHHCESISAWRGASPLSRSSSVVCAARRTARASEPDSHPLLTITSPRALPPPHWPHLTTRSHTANAPSPEGRALVWALDGMHIARAVLLRCWPAEPLARCLVAPPNANHRPVCLAPLAGPQRRPPRVPPHEHTLKCTHTHTHKHAHARTHRNRRRGAIADKHRSARAFASAGEARGRDTLASPPSPHTTEGVSGGGLRQTAWGS